MTRSRGTPGNVWTGPLPRVRRGRSEATDCGMGDRRGLTSERRFELTSARMRQLLLRTCRRAGMQGWRVARSFGRTALRVALSGLVFLASSAGAQSSGRDLRTRLDVAADVVERELASYRDLDTPEGIARAERSQRQLSAELADFPGGDSLAAPRTHLRTIVVTWDFANEDARGRRFETPAIRLPWGGTQSLKEPVRLCTRLGRRVACDGATRTRATVFHPAVLSDSGQELRVRVLSTFHDGKRTDFLLPGRAPGLGARYDVITYVYRRRGAGWHFVGTTDGRISQGPGRLPAAPPDPRRVPSA